MACRSPAMQLITRGLSQTCSNTAFGARRSFTVTAVTMAQGKPAAPHHPPMSEQKRQRRAYLDQMSALRREFKAELAKDEAVVVARREAVKATQVAFTAKKAAEREIRKMAKNERGASMASVQSNKSNQNDTWAEEARKKQEKKLMERMEEKFVNIHAETGTWVSDMDDAEALIQDALVNAYKPHARMRYNPGYKDYRDRNAPAN